MCLAQRPQRSDAGEARTRGLLVLSQTLYHRATALPKIVYDTPYNLYLYLVFQYIFINIP